MILTCPACATRYLTDPAVLGPAGRMVRCAKCAHSWMQAPPADMPRQVDLPPPPPPPPPAAPGSRVNLPTRFVPPRRRVGAGVLLLAGVLVALVLFGAYMGREPIVAAWPPAERFYSALGIRAVALGAGLKLDATFVRRRIEGEDVIVIEGHVSNTTDVAQPVPMLRAMLRNDRNQWLTDWTFTIEQSELQPGESATFTTMARNPPEASKRLSITFTDRPVGG